MSRIEKSKPKIHKLLLFLFLTMTLTNCQKEENNTEQNKNIKTVSIDETLGFLKEHAITTDATTSKKTVLSPDTANITQEKIINSDQFMTVIPVFSTEKESTTRLVLLKVHNVLKSAIVKMTPDQKVSTEFFSGKLFLYRIDGSLITGFKVENGLLVIQYFGAEKRISKSTGGEIELREVIIINRYHKSYALDVEYFDWASGGASPESSADMSYMWGSSDGGGGNSNPPQNNTGLDPCETAAQATLDAKSTTFTAAKAAIIAASSDGKEHSITLGRSTYNEISQAPMNNGGQYNVVTNTTWPGAFAVLHNHPNNTKPSAGDIYASVTLNEKSVFFNTSFVLTGGEVYAIVVTDLAAAQAFVKAYPAYINPPNTPEFPDSLFYEMEALRPAMGYSQNGLAIAMAYVLDQHNSGITLFKQDSTGDFQPIKIKQITQPNGNKAYTTVPCY
ncbi:hypothetical protein SGQ83_14155 [Flavobacterium sp. Fl-318]|uniref:Uncharacterized protein n=1 Tax=Flavobacterium cupriresistens TaxID=2893885 RepID=A0ABU4RJ14_9FLAO|nr:MULTISPECIES: hypothetical protein [unclassified Flavobacterium]MDX6190501.1 hypothetical protein [Flavobacterium sp. Fl-318]UFH43561.1 hypothetical protein LNP23_04930 [Flavobacterium sp. F-323]